MDPLLVARETVAFHFLMLFTELIIPHLLNLRQCEMNKLCSLLLFIQLGILYISAVDCSLFCVVLCSCVFPGVDLISSPTAIFMRDYSEPWVPWQDMITPSYFCH